MGTATCMAVIGTVRCSIKRKAGRYDWNGERERTGRMGQIRDRRGVRKIRESIDTVFRVGEEINRLLSYLLLFVELPVSIVNVPPPVESRVSSGNVPVVARPLWTLSPHSSISICIVLLFVCVRLITCFIAIELSSRRHVCSTPLPSHSPLHRRIRQTWRLQYSFHS